MAHHRSSRHNRKKSDRRRRADFAPVYILIVFVGAALWLLTWLFGQGQEGVDRAIVVGYLVLIAVLAHLQAYRAYRGKRLATWQKALAAMPLRMMGFGSRAGRPIDAAHGDARVPRVLVATGIVSLVVLAAVAYWWLGLGRE